MRELFRAVRDLSAAEWRRAAALSVLVTVASLIFPVSAAAQVLNINLGSGAGLTERVVQLIGLMTVLSLAPSIVIMTTFPTPRAAPTRARPGITGARADRRTPQEVPPSHRSHASPASSPIPAERESLSP